jgi:aspartyl aminopeptidase
VPITGKSVSDVEVSAFIDFLDKCPTPFHFGAHARSLLLSHGYTELFEHEDWSRIPPKSFVLRDGRTLLAFNLTNPSCGLMICTHNDSPCLVLKPGTEVSDARSIRIAPYGGPTLFTWMHRELRLAGAVYHRSASGQIARSLFDSHSAVAFLPGIPGGSGTEEIDLDDELNPVFALGGRLVDYVAGSLGIEASTITDWDLRFIGAQGAAVIGARSDFIASGRLDNLSSTFAALTAFLAAEGTPDSSNLLAVFDHEEIGSISRNGARGNIISSVLLRVLGDARPSFEAASLAISADCAHLLHPNFPTKHDPVLAPEMGGGIVVKWRVGAEYATEIAGAWVLRQAAKNCGVGLQDFQGTSSASGETIGPLIAALNGIATVDIGIGQLSMHAVREVAAVKDVEAMVKLMGDLYSNFGKYRLPQHA